MNLPLLFLFLLVSSKSSNAGTGISCHNAIQKHLDEAILYNKNVTNRYSKLTNGQSRPLSISLIAIERISTMLVKNMEEQANLYRQNGIPVLCEELGDMKDVPTFQERLTTNLRPLKYFKYNYDGLSKKLEQLMNEDKTNEAYELLSDELRILEDYPYQKCLTRHFLESMAKTLKLSDSHRFQAEKLGLPDPIGVMKKFITIQRRALLLTNFLDRKAFPLQKQGIMIYCQDIPTINWK